MKAVNIVMTAVWIALLAGIAAAGVKNVAVVETEIDDQSGAAAKITKAEVRLVTAELRREAVNNLPRDKYNIMTTETVYAQGSATLEACAEENCVITLGAKIGADYIVRGIISKLQTRLTLTVEIYETEDGNLVASSAPIRSENIDGLVDKAAEVCADMYRKFAGEQSSAQTPKPEQPAPYYTITAAANPNNGGYVSRNPEQTHYAPGTIVSVTATPASGYEFTGWSGASTSTNATLKGQMKRDLTLTANFSRNSDLDVESKTEPVGWVSEPEPENTSYSAVMEPPDEPAAGEPETYSAMYGAFDNHVAWKPESNFKSAAKNALLLDIMPLLSSYMGRVAQCPTSSDFFKAFTDFYKTFGFGLQYERRLFYKFSLLVRYDYLGIWDYDVTDYTDNGERRDYGGWNGSYDDLHGSRSVEDWSSNIHTFEIHARYYPSGAIFFLDGIMGYYANTISGYYIDDENKYYGTYHSTGTYDYLKGGVSLGLRQMNNFGKDSGFTLELSLGWIFAFSGNYKGKGGAVVDNAIDKYGAFFGGAGPRFVCAFGWRL